MNDTNLPALRDKIEAMEKINQLRVLEIIKKTKMEFTENANGIFINMSLLVPATIVEINNYIKYIKLQQLQLDQIENEKGEIKKTFYKDNKDKGSYR